MITSIDLPKRPEGERVEESSTAVQNLTDLTEGMTLQLFFFFFFLKSFSSFKKPFLGKSKTSACSQLKLEEATCAYEIVEKAGAEQARMGRSALLSGEFKT